MNLNILLMNWSSKLPDNAAMTLQKSLESLDESKILALQMLNLKDPIIGLILGLVFGLLGVDRFYKGDIWLGVAKLILTVTGFGMIVSVPWAIIDYFLVWKGIKQDNLSKIITQIALLK